ATVVVSIPSAPTLPPAEPVATAMDGSFEVPDRSGPGDRLRLTARRAGYADAELLRSWHDEGEVVLSLRRGRPRRIEGRVVDSRGDGAADAVVEVAAAAGVLDVDATRTRTDSR